MVPQSGRSRRCDKELGRRCTSPVALWQLAAVVCGAYQGSNFDTSVEVHKDRFSERLIKEFSRGLGFTDRVN